MIQDKLLMFSDGQAVTATAASATAIEVGGDEVAKTLNLCAQVTEAFAGITSLALEVQTTDKSAAGDSHAPSASDGDWTTLASYPAAPVAGLSAGSRPWGFQKLPYGLKKFVRVKYVVDGGPASAGKVDAFLTPSLEVE